MKWIPCKERQPDETTLALVTNADGDTYIALYDIWMGRGEWTIPEVIAWMPLPQPYTEETNA